MNLNTEFAGYTSLYILSILVMIIVFFKLKNFLLDIIKNLVNDLNSRFQKYHNMTDTMIEKRLQKNIVVFDETIKQQNKINQSLHNINLFLEQSLLDKLSILSQELNKRTELEREIIKLKKIIKRMEKNGL